jgi:hypothetical protein
LSKIPYIWTCLFFPFRGMMLSGTLSVACGFLFALVWFAVCALNALQAGLCLSCKLPETTPYVRARLESASLCFRSDTTTQGYNTIEVNTFVFTLLYIVLLRTEHRLPRRIRQVHFPPLLSNAPTVGDSVGDVQINRLVNDQANQAEASSLAWLGHRSETA